LRRQVRVLLVLAVAAAVLAACSGAPRPQALNAGGTRAGRAGKGAGGGDAAGADTTTTAPGSAAAAGGPSTVPAGGAAAAAAGSKRGGGAGGTGTGGAGGTSGGDQPGDPHLFTDAQNRRGISAGEIHLCGHAALIFAKAFNTDVKDINVYWDWVNKKYGGVYGRKVTADWQDDQYDGAQAVKAATACQQENPFMILGGIGFDQIPGVRVWAEQNHELYIHHIAVGKGAEGLQYSFTMQPTVEDTGRAFGEYIAKHHASQSVGVVYRVSEDWQPGADAAESYLKAHNVRIVANIGVSKNQSAYSNEIVQLQQADGGKGAQVVFLWENALAAEEFIQQAHQQGYHPTFIVFPFQTTLDLLGSDAFKSPIEGVSTWPAYKPGGYGDVYPEHAYNAEIKEFEAAMADIDPGTAPNDILWQTWLGFKQLRDMFLLCSKDCTRNHFAGLMLNGYKTPVEPNCPVDFTRGNHHRGAWDFMTMSAFKADDGKPYYQTTQWCSEHLS
jgi:ABC-type branched-subunit amino acid transport system substrate-binding protein